MLETRQTIELRATGNRLVGYASVFDSRSADLGGFIEVVKPGAFSRSLSAKVDVPALFDHDRRAILGRTSSGTLRLEEDGRGLAFEIDVPATSVGRDVLELVGRRDITGASFAFTATSENWMKDGSAIVRELLDVDLIEVTITAQPAYADTTVARRSMADAFGLPRPRLRSLRRFLDTV